MNFETASLDILAVIGLTIMLAFLGSKVIKRLGIPQVVGYVVVGVLLGPSFLNLIPDSLSAELGFISEVALGLIGFEMGSHLRLEDLRRLGRSITLIVLSEGIGSFLLVGGGIYLVTRSIPLAVLLGAVASATAPAATVEVLAEYRSEGPLTTTLLAVVGLDDALALLLYTLSATLAESLFAHTGSLPIGSMLLLSVKEIGGALLLGFGVGLPFQWALNRLKERHAVCAFIVGMIFFVAGLSSMFEVSLILTLMVIGIVVANIWHDNSQYARCVAERVGPLAYTLFFALAGAHLRLSALPEMGLVGLAYLLLRAGGKVGGASLGARIGRAPAAVQKYLGFGLLSQAGVAIGLALATAHRFDAYGEAGVALSQTIINVVAATVFVAELVGPVMVKFAIVHAGEVDQGQPMLDMDPAHDIE